METLKLIVWVTVFIIAMILIYRAAKGNTDYKRNQRYGVPPYSENDRRSERK